MSIVQSNDISSKPPKPPDMTKTNVTVNSDVDTEDTNTRYDSTVRAFETKFFNYDTVPMKLNTFIRNEDPQFLNLFHGFIDRVVGDLNLIAYHAWHLLNLHFIRLLENKIPLPGKIDQTLIQRVCQYVSTIKGKLTVPKSDPQWLLTQQLYVVSYPIGYKFPARDKKCNLINNLAKMMVTNIENHFNLNWRSRFYRYLRTILKESNGKNMNGGKLGYIVDRIMGHIPDPSHPSKWDNIPEIEAIISKYRKELKEPVEYEAIFNKHLIYLPYLYEMLKSAVAHKQKLFSLFPESGELVSSHIKICTSSFADMISTFTDEPIVQDINEARKLWRKYFNIESVEIGMTKPNGEPWKNGRNRRIFCNEIVTNGYDVCITIKSPKDATSMVPYPEDATDEQKALIIRAIYAAEKAVNKGKPPKIPVEKEMIQPNTYTNHIGLDPGKNAPFTTCDDNGVTKQCSKAEYHHMIGLNKYRNQLKVNSKLPKMVDMQKILSANSFKVSTVTAYLASLSKVAPLLKTMLEEYSRDFYRKNKFLRRIKKMKAYKKMKNKLLKGEKGPIVIGYGSGLCNGKGIKGSSMPVKGFYNYLVRCGGKKIKVIKIYENLTTKMCSKCEHETGVVKCHKEIQLSDGEKRILKVNIHALRRCKHNECRITWNRDVNASRNIHRLLKTEYTHGGGARPQYLCHKKVGKTAVQVASADPTIVT